MVSMKALQTLFQRTNMTCSAMILTRVKSAEYLHGLIVSFGEESQ